MMARSSCWPSRQKRQPSSAIMLLAASPKNCGMACVVISASLRVTRAQTASAGRGLELLPREGRAQAAQRAPRLGAERVLDGVGVVEHAAQHVDERAGFVGLEHEPVAVARRGNGPPSAAFEVRQQAVPHRAVELAFGGVEFFEFERFDDLHEVREVVGALDVAAHPVEQLRHAARHPPRRAGKSRADGAGATGA